jgi:hypothetical protein
MADTQEIQPDKKMSLPFWQEAEEMGMIPILWDTDGKRIHDIGWNYRRAITLREKENSFNAVSKESYEEDYKKWKENKKHEREWCETSIWKRRSIC